ncbi:MAG TPA: serine/threonine-protein kinase [Kofleriaceae bacterium]|jgi:serine/threonine-protein kinase|nr:serine/threonine-protein kinase [Kofleriaceae bacterium]
MIRTAALGEANDLTRVERRDPLVGTVLDQCFRMDHLLAAGGFGAVYRAIDLRSDAPVALKVLHAKYTRDPRVATRFRREGKMLAGLRDPHTITAYEFGEAPDGTLYIAMELLHGESLYQRFHAGGPLPWWRVVHIARGVCSSLAEAHAAGIVHRDLKPANIHLETRGNDPEFAKVLDFGIAKIVQGGGRERTQLTQTGTMIGTLEYMSPEQMISGELTAASDIYTLGVVMYEMIAGHTPFADAQTATAILAAVLTRTPDPLSQYANVPPALDQIVARCLELEVPNRFADIRELAGALAGVAETGHVRSVRSVHSDPAVPPGDLEQPMLSTEATWEATWIDVRSTESDQPVLDVRGPRYRPDDLLDLPPAVRPPSIAPILGGVVAPAAYPPATPVPRSTAPVAYAPVAPVGYPAAPVPYPAAPAVRAAATPIALPIAPAAYPPATPYLHPAASAASAIGSQQAIDARGLAWRGDGAAPQPGREPAGWPPPSSSPPPPLGQPDVASRTRGITHNLRSYDMSAAATRDARVRRILWITLLVCAVLALVIASR